VRRTWRTAVVAAAIALAGCASVEKPASGIPYLEPARVPITSFRITGNEYRFEKEGLVVVAAYLSEKGLDDYYSGQGLTNPFTVLYPFLRPTVFVVRIENHTKKMVYLNPSMSGMVDNNGKPYVNRDLTDFYPYLGDDEERRARMGALQVTLYDTQLKLSPGNASERLLAFDAMGGELKGVKLILRDLYVGDLPLDIPFAFDCRYR